MFKKILFILFLFPLFQMSKAQDGCDILVNLRGLNYDTLWFGHTFGKRSVPEFFALKNADGTYRLKSSDPMPEGMYAIIFKRAENSSYQYFQCWLADGQREFEIETSALKPYATARIKRSPENELFYRYLTELETAQRQLEDDINTWRYRQDEPSFRQRIKAEETFRQFQDEFMEKAPGTLTAKLIAQTLLPIPPPTKSKFKNWQEENEQRWLWQRRHYFDQMDISQPGFLRYVQWLNATDSYLFTLSPPDPDTLKTLLDETFERLSAFPEGLQYYQKYLINSLVHMSQFRTDEVFVYLVREYVETGKTPWVSAGDKQRMISDADRAEQLFVGKKAPNFQVIDRDSNPVSLYEIQAPCVILTFWLPDCSHCKREMPLVKRVYNRFKPEDLKVMSVCAKMGEQVPDCWEFNDTREMPAEWYSVVDPQRRSGMASLYNLRSYPRIFILDAEKNIVYKRMGETTELELETTLQRVLRDANH